MSRPLLTVVALCSLQPLTAGGVSTQWLPPTAHALNASQSGEKQRLLPVQVQISNRTLGEAMEEIAHHSRTSIRVAEQLKAQPFPQSITGSNWHSALNKLLASYNHLAILDRGGEFRKIWITGVKAPTPGQNQIEPGTKNAGSIAAAAHVPDPPTDLPTPIWEPLPQQVDAADRSAPGAAPIEVNTEFFDSIQVGQAIEIPIPQESAPVFAVVGETHSQLNGRIQVWSGPVDGSHETASFTITRGDTSTYITIATGTSIYEANFEHATGIGSVINEVELTKNASENDYVLVRQPGTDSGTE